MAFREMFEGKKINQKVIGYKFLSKWEIEGLKCGYYEITVNGNTIKEEVALSAFMMYILDGYGDIIYKRKTYISADKIPVLFVEWMDEGNKVHHSI